MHVENYCSPRDSFDVRVASMVPTAQYGDSAKGAVSTSGNEPRPKKTCRVIRLSNGNRRTAQPNSTSCRCPRVDATRRAHKRDANLARNNSPEYMLKARGSP